MKTEDKQSLLSYYLWKFRTWSCAELAARIPAVGEPLETADGTHYQIEINVFWDSKKDGAIRVFGSLEAEPHIFLPGGGITSDVCAGFIMAPDGRFVGE